MNLFTAQSNEIEEFWPYIEELVVKAIGAGSDRFDSEDVKDLLKNADAQLWVVEDDGIKGMWITSIEATRHSKACEVMWLAGVKDDSNAIKTYWPLYQETEKWAQSIGCDRMYIYGRKGWAKMMPGYEPTCVVMERCFGNDTRPVT